MPTAFHWPPKDVSILLPRVCAEYDELPGMRLTLRQVQRLWSLDETRAMALMTALLDAGYLEVAHDGSFIRSSNPRRGARRFPEGLRR